jgi:mono/diheme cytochrome c family protein
MKKVMLGSFLSLVFIAIGAYMVLASGRFPIAASSPPDAIDDLAASMSARAITYHARGVTTLPGKAGPDSVSSGLARYRSNCLPCHGAPGVTPAEFSQGLNPMPPALHVDAVQERPDPELFWIIQNGIRMTGMPAFGDTRSAEEIGDIVRFVRRLPKLSDEERARLSGPAEDHRGAE